MDQRAEGDGEKYELPERAGAGERDQAGVAARRAQKRQGTLDQRQAESQHQGVVTDLGDHCRTFSSAASPWRQTPACFSASATSGGI